MIAIPVDRLANADVSVAVQHAFIRKDVVRQHELGSECFRRTITRLWSERLRDWKERDAEPENPKDTCDHPPNGGSSSASTRTRIVRAAPGCFEMRPRCSSVVIMLCTEGGVT